MTHSTFSWEDPFQLQALLSEEEIAIQKTAADYAQQELAPRVQQAFRSEHFDRAIFLEMGKLGLLGSTLPSQFGCADINYTAYGLIAREIEKVDSGYRSALSVQSSLVMYPIFKYGSDAQRKKYLPPLAAGEHVGCFGLTEPDHGSDPGSMATKAIKVEGGFRLNGQKMWITNSPIADTLLIWAKLDGKIRGFIVERDFQGLSTPTIAGKLSLRSSITGEIILEDVFVPGNNLLPNAEGLSGPFGCLNKARFGISWGVMGAAEDCWFAARQYSLDRHPI